MAGVWSEDLVAGKPLDVFEPQSPHPLGWTVLYLHGVHLNRLCDNGVFTRLLDEHGLRCVAPMTQRSWWTDRICEEFDPELTAERHLLDNVLPYIERRFGAGPPRIALLGTSMGGQGALRLAFKRPDLFPIVAALSPAIDFHLRMRDGDDVLQSMYPSVEAARQDTAILHVHPLHWVRHVWFCCDPTDERWWDSSDRLRMKLFSMGIPFASDLETSGGGHGLEYYNRMAPAAFKFLIERLEQERRRVV